MKITDITPQVKNTNRYNVFIDGEFAFGIDGDDLLAHRLVKGADLTQDELDFLVSELEFSKARDAALRYLAHGPRSRREVVRRLKIKGFGEAGINRALELMEKYGYVNDAAFAKQFVEHKTKFDNYGKRRIVAELAQKGVAKDDILAAYGEVVTDEDELEAAARALEKKLRNKDAAEILADYKERERIKGFLARRGFSYATIDRAIEQRTEG